MKKSYDFGLKFGKQRKHIQTIDFSILTKELAEEKQTFPNTDKRKHALCTEFHSESGHIL